MMCTDSGDGHANDLQGTSALQMKACVEKARSCFWNQLSKGAKCGKITCCGLWVQRLSPACGLFDFWGHVWPLSMDGECLTPNSMTFTLLFRVGPYFPGSLSPLVIL